MMKCLIDPRPLLQYDFGPHHPFKIHRLGLTYNLLSSYGLVDREDVRTVEPREAAEAEAEVFHTEEYLEALQRASVGMWVPDLHLYGLGTGDNPVFAGVYEWAMSVAGASIDMASEVASGRVGRAFNLSGGLHHAMPGYASGFCHVNDGAVAIQALVNQGLRVAYVDIDAHHGDGVQHAFYNTPEVLTVSIHQTGYTIFPGTGFVDDIGTPDARGYSVNVPLRPGAGDAAYGRAMDEIILPAIAAFRPDVLVTQLGADALFGDVVANLKMSLRQFEASVRQFRDLGFPWLALGGGGYDVGNVVRAWTLSWGVMLDEQLPDEIPSAWATEAAAHGVYVPSLRGPEGTAPTPDSVMEDLDKTIDLLRTTTLPVLEEAGSGRTEPS